MQSPSIPMVDLEAARAGSDEERARVAGQLFDALRVSGFAYAVNHGIPEEMLDEAFQRSKDFFALPLATKEKSARPQRATHQRGYSRLSREKLSQMVFDSAGIAELRQKPDIKESFDMGRDDETDYYNVWPEEVEQGEGVQGGVAPGFRAFWMDFFARMAGLERELLRLIAAGLDQYALAGGSGRAEGGGIGEDYLVGYHEQQDNQVRLLRYPAVSKAALRQGTAERIAAHTDFGTLTMLFQDEVGGLEVEEPGEAGRFRAVPGVAGTVVVNVGDLLMRWSNGVLKSTMHRVGAPLDPGGLGSGGGSARDQEAAGGGELAEERYSIAYFCMADKDRLVDCLPGCSGPGRPRRFEATTSRAYIDMRMAAISSG